MLNNLFLNRVKLHLQRTLLVFGSSSESDRRTTSFMCQPACCGLEPVDSVLYPSAVPCLRVVLCRSPSCQAGGLWRPYSSTWVELYTSRTRRCPGRRTPSTGRTCVFHDYHTRCVDGMRTAYVIITAGCWCLCAQITAGVSGREVCDQHHKGEQEEPPGTTAASRLQHPGRTRNPKIKDRKLWLHQQTLLLGQPAALKFLKF